MNPAQFTHHAAQLVAANDRVPPQREPDSRPIEPAGTVIEVEGGTQFVSNGVEWLMCGGFVGSTYRGISAEDMNRRYMWWIVSMPCTCGAVESGVGERMSG